MRDPLGGPSCERGGGAGGDPGAFARLLVRCASRADWAVPHRTAVVMALSQLVRADWDAVGLASPGPVVEALRKAPARAPLLEYCGLALWSVRACVPAIVEAVVAGSSEEVQAEVVQVG